MRRLVTYFRLWSRFSYEAAVLLLLVSSGSFSLRSIPGFSGLTWYALSIYMLTTI